MGRIPERWAPRGRAISGRRSSLPPPKPSTSRPSRISKPEKKPSGSRRPSMDVAEGINRWLPYGAVGRRISGTRLIAFKVPLKHSYVRRLDAGHQFTVDRLLDSVPELGLVIDLTQTDRYYNKQDVLDRGIHYCKIPCPGQQIPPEKLVLRFFSAIDFYLEHHNQDNTLIGVHCTHGVNRTGYMLARYMVQRLGMPAREAAACVASARGHEIERKQYLNELENNTAQIPKNSSDKDIQFSRMRHPSSRPDTGRIPPSPPRVGSLGPGAIENWRSPPTKHTTIGGSPGRSKFNGRMMPESRDKPESRDVGRKFSPPCYGRPPEPNEKYMGYREPMWDKEDVGRSRKRSRDTEVRSGAGSYRMRSMERHMGQGRGGPPEGEPSIRELYDDRYRRRESPPPSHYGDKHGMEDSRRHYRGDRPSDIPMDVVMDKHRRHPDDYMRPIRDRPPNVEGIPSYDHPERMDRFEGSNMFGDDPRPYIEHMDRRMRDDMRPPSPHYRERYPPGPPHYEHGANEPGPISYLHNRRIDEPNRQFEPDLPVGGRRMESGMPVGGRRMNESLERSSQRRHIPDEPHMMRGRIDDIPLSRGRIADEMPMRHAPRDMERSLNREMEDHFRSRRESRRSFSPGRPGPGYMDSYGPRGGEIGAYGIGPHTSGRYGSPMRPSGGEQPVPDIDMRRRPSSPPGHQWPPHSDFGHADGPPFRDYGPPRREPSFRRDEPPPPGIEAEMRRDIQERGRKRTPQKDSKSRRRSKSRNSRSASRSKLRNISPRKVRPSKQNEPNASRGFIVQGEMARHPQERMSTNWPSNVSPSHPSVVPQLEGHTPPGREVWIDEHPPVRSRIDDGPDCRLIINKKRSNIFPEENKELSRHGGSGPPGREDRRHLSPTKASLEHDRNRGINNELRSREGSGRVEIGDGIDRMIRRGHERSRTDGSSVSGGGGGAPPPPPSIGGGPGTSRRTGGGPHSDRIRGGADRMPSRGGRDVKKPPVFERLDVRRGGGGNAWPR